MAIATYGGLAIFGAAATVRPSREPRDMQRNTFPGLDGVEALDLGGRGGATTVEGTWFLPGGDVELGAVLATWEALMDGRGRVLIDTLGRPWANVLLNPYRLEGRRLNGITGAVVQKFTGSLTHLE